MVCSASRPVLSQEPICFRLQCLITLLLVIPESGVQLLAHADAGETRRIILPCAIAVHVDICTEKIYFLRREGMEKGRPCHIQTDDVCVFYILPWRTQKPTVKGVAKKQRVAAYG